MSAAGPYRLGGKLRGRTVEFQFDGRLLRGVEGDTVASALLANGIRIVSRSFKFHRPRGIFSAGFEEPNALVQLNVGAHAVPSARATLVPLQEGLQVFSQSGWPSVSRDALRAIDLVHNFFAAGFYNKTFIWPSWKTYEPIIRKLAGLGRVPGGPDPDRYDTHHAYYDVLVVGGGPAGVAAATQMAATGRQVLLVEQAGAFDSAAALHTLENLRLFPNTTAVACYDHNLVALAETVNTSGSGAPRERLWLVRAAKIVLATGAIEQPLIFANNDRPGIMLAGAALKYLQRHAIAPGRKVVIATNNDSAYRVARELLEAGVDIKAVLDSRAAVPGELTAPFRVAGVAVLARSMPIDTAGFGALKRVSIATLGSVAGVSEVDSLPCDALLVSGGWSPVLHLFAQAGGKLAFSKASQTFLPLAPHASIELVGAAADTSAQNLGPRVSPVGNTSRQWVDLRHDVTVSDIELAVRENLTSVEHIKRYTTLGMSVDQGKVGQAPATEVIAKVRGVNPEDLGHTTFRPPFVPVTIGTLVGRGVGEFFAPIRRTPLHALQEQAGALFDDFGDWQRAAAFPKHGETRDQAMHREVQLVRHGVGLYDASPLGKIELVGPHALAFADRFYINNLSTLKLGRTRYGIMLRETGIVFDDGTAVILDEDRVLLTTTSSGAGRVHAWLEEWRQCEWPQARVVVLPVTEQWGTVSIGGQHARTVLQRLRPECDLSNDAFPHLSMRVAKLLGCEARIYRVSFNGELNYEINVPSHKAALLWSALMEEGRAFGIAPYGVDALLHLRMEKGFLHVGADTDGATVPDDIGFGKPAAAKQRHYIGKRSLTLPDNIRPDRLQLVGLAGDGATLLPVGGHLRLHGSAEATDGWVTSAGPLSTDGKPVGMATLRAGRSQMGQAVTVHDDGRVVTTAKVVTPMFYDPAGARMNA